MQELSVPPLTPVHADSRPHSPSFVYNTCPPWPLILYVGYSLKLLIGGFINVGHCAPTHITFQRAGPLAEVRAVECVYCVHTVGLMQPCSHMGS